ncbi:unnamed protein product [Amoebophrya sp. A25]|nr:unnamed protein product [Amoebophrya sp. A25]|eukprot:GSA25T00002971001.1
MVGSPPSAGDPMEEEGGEQPVAVAGAKREGSVSHVAMTLGFFERRVVAENCPLWRKSAPKIICAIHGSADLKVCEMKKDLVTKSLAPFAKISLPSPSSKIHQLEAWGSSLWRSCIEEEEDEDEETF